MTSLTLDVEYVRLATADLADDLAVEVGDDELKAMYEEDRAAASSADAQRQRAYPHSSELNPTDEAAALTAHHRDCRAH